MSGPSERENTTESKGEASGVVAVVAARELLFQQPRLVPLPLGQDDLVRWLTRRLSLEQQGRIELAIDGLGTHTRVSTAPERLDPPGLALVKHPIADA